jgi:hypothetical protein
MKSFFESKTGTWFQRVAIFATGVAAGVFAVPVIVAKVKGPSAS